MFRHRSKTATLVEEISEMPNFCAVFQCGNNFNSDDDKSCYWLPAVVTSRNGSFGPSSTRFTRFLNLSEYYSVYSVLIIQLHVRFVR